MDNVSLPNLQLSFLIRFVSNFIVLFLSCLAQVSYEAGSDCSRLRPLYMSALDTELIPTLHAATTNLQPEQPIVIELIFYVMDV